ncbi:hypothetical protein [Nocardioides sp. B-3]|uniref:hypothetical protein n=1 Tax=Nocardioides sp. B-3 TaxID=2895565 RepID=UPI002152F57A|nr:hypothetical protein [Nocardioides sp. B-3]
MIYSGMDEAKADAAIAFVKFMSSAESQAFAAEELGVLPANEAAYDLVADNERVLARKPAPDVAHARPWIPEGGLFFTPLDKMTTKIPVGKADVKKTLDEAAAEFKSDVVPDYSEQ